MIGKTEVKGDGAHNAARAGSELLQLVSFNVGDE